MSSDTRQSLVPETDYVGMGHKNSAVQAGGNACSAACRCFLGCLYAVWAALQSCCKGCCKRSMTVNGRRLAVQRLLAEGGFGFVYSVKDSTGQQFALKKMILQDRDSYEAAKQEVAVHVDMARTGCSFILPVIDHCITAPQPGQHQEALLLMPLMTSSLQDLLTRLAPSGRFLSEPFALQHLSELCVAVQHMHHHKPPLAHRDIKPGNIMITASGHSMLADFGSTIPARQSITSRLEAMTAQDHAAEHSSMPYRAPELYDVQNNSTITEKTDVWSIGCTLYAMLYGYSPFEVDYRGGSVPRVVECSHLRVIGPLPFPHPNPASPEVVELIKWLLQANPDDRPDIDMVLDRLESMQVTCYERLAGASEEKQAAPV